MQIENMKIGNEERIIHFSMNERIILNTLITGLCICVLVGTSVYLTDKLGATSSVGIWSRIYLFETLAMNTYFALSIGFMCFTERRISRPIEQLTQIVGSYYAKRVTDAERERMIDACGVYAKDSTEVGSWHARIFPWCGIWENTWKIYKALWRKKSVSMRN